MISVLLPTFFLSFFGLFNLLGIKKDLLSNQVVFLGIAIGFYFVTRKIGIFFFKNNAKFFYWLFVGLLIVTYIIGAEIRGSRRWIDFYFFNFQPSEFFKLFFIIYFADYFSRLRKELENPQVLFKSLMYFSIPTFIILKQPDLGNALVYAVIYLSILLFSPVPKRYLFYLFSTCLVLLPSAWFFLHDYQKARIISFLNPELHQLGTGYNMIQAIITAGSGQFFGKGLGFGTQSKLFFLPENHTDFVFSSLIEQFGFIGGFIVLGLYFFLIIRLIQKITEYIASREEENLFFLYFLIGFFAFFSFQTLVNIGMNVGLLPIVGIALPFISYGGSSLVSLFMSLALIP